MKNLSDWKEKNKILKLKFKRKRKNTDKRCVNGNVKLRKVKESLKNLLMN